MPPQRCKLATSIRITERELNRLTFFRAALQDLAQGPTPSTVIDLTAEPVSHLYENYSLLDLTDDRILYRILARRLRLRNYKVGIHLSCINIH